MQTQIKLICYNTKIKKGQVGVKPVPVRDYRLKITRPLRTSKEDVKAVLFEFFVQKIHIINMKNMSWPREVTEKTNICWICHYGYEQTNFTTVIREKQCMFVLRLSSENYNQGVFLSQLSIKIVFKGTLKI